MRKIQKVTEYLKYNLWTLVKFEFLFKLVSVLIFTPLFLDGFNLIMKFTGYKYLTLENIVSFLSNPLTIIMGLILIMLMTFYTMFDITTIIIILDQSYQKKKISVVRSMYLALSKCKNTFHFKNILMAFLVLFLIPFLNVGVTSSLISTIKIPEFIKIFIINNKILFLIGILLVIILVFLLLRWIYSLHYFVLENLNFKEARKKSIALSKRKHVKDLLSILGIQFVYAIIYVLFVASGILLILLFNKIFHNIIWIKSITTTVIWVFIALSFVIVTVLAVPISYASISVLYYLHKCTKREKIISIKVKKIEENKKSNCLKKIIGLLIIISIITGSFFTYGIYKGKYNLNIEFTRTLEVTAHRGASKSYPENTMSAFVGAKLLGADWIELDVQATKDKELIVVHDSNLKRITGVNKRTWELTYEEIKSLDAGSFFGSEFKGEMIPKLEDVIVFAKENNIKLNIELKPTGHEENFESSVIDVIKKYNFMDDCVVASQVYEVLENVKKIDNNIKTLYVMSLAYGDILSFTDADHFSIEEMSVTKNLVDKIHKEGKELYVWTINSEESVRKLLDLKVDNVITDDVVLAKDIIYSSKTTNMINEYIKLIESLFV